jgi:hypothetical protein
VWSLRLAEEERGTNHHRANRNSSLAMQEPAHVLDKGVESDDDSTISNSSESLFESHLEEDGSDFEAEKSDCKVQRASSALKPTAGCIDSSPHNDYASRSRREDTEGLKSLGFEGALEDLMLRFGYFLVTEEYEDGRSASTLLVYFSGVLGISINGLTFERPSNYTTKLSALIYCSRLLLIKLTLPRFAHQHIGWPARPRYDHSERLNRVRRDKMCLRSQAPIDELLSLRNYGRAIGRSNGPTFRVT